MIVNERLQLNVLRVSSIPFGALCLAILLNSWNAPVAGGLRLNDMFLITSFMLVIFLCRFSALFLFIFFLLLISILMPLLLGSANSIPKNMGNLGFVYKYLMIVAVPLVALSVVDSLARIALVEKILFFSFILLVFWAYYYTFLVDSGALYGVSRVSFPGSKDFLVSDAHLYSNYLGMSLMFYLLFYQRRHDHNVALVLALSALAVGALVLTGSRNGIVVTSLGLLFWFCFSAIYRKYSFTGRSLVLGFLSFLCLGFFVLYFWSGIFQFLSEAASRAFNFNLQSDMSSLRRIEKFEVAVEDWLGSSILFGSGILYASMTWYDSGAGILLAHTGLFGILLFVVLASYFVVFCVKNLNSDNIRASFILFILYSISNLITEFSLVTRSMLPSVLYICIPVIVDKLRYAQSEFTK